MEQTREEFNRTKGKMVDDFKTIVSDADALLQATAGAVGADFSAQRASFAEKIRNAKNSLANVEQIVVEKAKQTAAATDVYVRENPWAAVGVAAGVGAVLGFLFASKRD